MCAIDPAAASQISAQRAASDVTASSADIIDPALNTNDHFRLLMEAGAQLVERLEEASLADGIVESLLGSTTSLAHRLVSEVSQSNSPLTASDEHSSNAAEPAVEETITPATSPAAGDQTELVETKLLDQNPREPASLQTQGDDATGDTAHEALLVELGVPLHVETHHEMQREGAQAVPQCAGRGESDGLTPIISNEHFRPETSAGGAAEVVVEAVGKEAAQPKEEATHTAVTHPADLSEAAPVQVPHEALTTRDTHDGAASGETQVVEAHSQLQGLNIGPNVLVSPLQAKHLASSLLN